MVKMDDYKEHLWVLPLIGGILALISIITPTATHVFSSTTTFYCWTWFILSVGQQVSFVINSDSTLLFVGLLSSFLILMALGTIIITTYKIKKDSIKKSTITLAWLVSGILILVGFIISVLSLNSYVLDGYIPSFGAFGQGIAAVIVIIGALLHMKANPRK